MRGHIAKKKEGNRRVQTRGAAVICAATRASRVILIKPGEGKKKNVSSSLIVAMT